MESEGPILESLTHRLAECPEDFLMTPRSGSTGVLDVQALFADQVRYLGALPTESLASDIGATELTLIAIVVWLLHDSWFCGRRHLASATNQLIKAGLGSLAVVVAPKLFITDPDRREELARFCLAQLGLRPQGESVAQAMDRLESLDSLERVLVLRDVRLVEERARQVRAMMAKRAAEEAAAKPTRE